MKERTEDASAGRAIDGRTRTARGSHAASRREERGIGAFFAELPVLVIIAFVLAILLKTFLVQAFFIPSESMLPTLEVGDRVLVNKVVYELRDPRRGEIVVFSQDEGGPEGAEENLLERLVSSLTSGLGLTRPGERDFIKRIVGLPGDTIEMRDGVVLIDGEALPEASARRGGYLAARDPQDFGPVTIPQGEYFMMGDNRRNSSDSRTLLGTISREEIIGRAFVVIWPVGRLGTLSTPDYDTAAEARAAPPGAISGSRLTHGEGHTTSIAVRERHVVGAAIGSGPEPR